MGLFAALQAKFSSYPIWPHFWGIWRPIKGPWPLVWESLMISTVQLWLLHKWTNSLVTINVLFIDKSVHDSQSLEVIEFRLKQRLNFYFLLSISTTFYARLFWTKVLCEAFLYQHKFVLFWRKNISAKAAQKCWWNWHLKKG